MALIRAAVRAALSFFLGTAAAVAQDVSLVSPDGAPIISGRLLSFDGEYYQLDTPYGVLTVDGVDTRCEGDGCPGPADRIVDLTLSGAAWANRKVLPALVRGFARAQGLRADGPADSVDPATYTLSDIDGVTARITLRATTVDEGFADLIAGEADLVIADRAVSPEERRLGLDAGQDDLSAPHRSRVLSTDAIVPIVAPGNPLDHMSPQALLDVLSGEIRDWTALEARYGAIRLHLPSPDLGLGPALAENVARVTEAGDHITFHPTYKAVADAVVADLGSIGLTTFAARGNAKALTLRGPCGFEMAASRIAAKTRDYPLSAPLMVYLPARRLPRIAREFLTYAQTRQAQAIVRRTGVVDLVIEEMEPGSDGIRLANAISATTSDRTLEALQQIVDLQRGARRLSATFRFDPGTGQMDAVSRAHLAGLLRMIDEGQLFGREILLMGHHDGALTMFQSVQRSTDMAERVARIIRQEIRPANQRRTRLLVHGGGKAMPIGCASDPWGLSANNRVEVWVR